MVGLWRMFKGSPFHSPGAGTENARPPALFEVASAAGDLLSAGSVPVCMTPGVPPGMMEELH